MAGGMRGGRKLKACIPGGSSMPVLPGDVMMACDMDYDSIAKAGSMLGSGAVIIMDDTTCMVKALRRLSYFYYEESCGQCTPCREGTGWLYRVVDRIETGRGKPEDLDLAHQRLRQHPGSHDLRARRCGGAAGEEFRPAFPRRVRLSHRAQAVLGDGRLLAAHRRRRQETMANLISLEIDGKAVEVPAGLHRDGCRQQARHLHPALLLAQEAVDRRQLPHVPGAGGEGAEAVAGVRDPGSRTARRSTPTRSMRDQGPAGGDGVPAHQSSARLPDLRSGRRVPAAGSGGGLRRERARATRKMKRVVPNKNLGPLISTDMTRCIHCTRCVRFGQEIAGVMELGMAGRGEHAEILAFVGKTVDSELSGNVIDLCPVGALTSKPFRYTARTWELTRKRSVSPHCGLGSNLVVQVKQNRVMRVLPLENEAINECWLSDKDRFSYEGLNAPDRLTAPMVREDGRVARSGLADRPRCGRQGARAGARQRTAAKRSVFWRRRTRRSRSCICSRSSRAASAATTSTSGCARPISAPMAEAPGIPWLGMKIAEVSGLDRALVVGSVLRKDHPLLAHRLRQATQARARSSPS